MIEKKPPTDVLANHVHQQHHGNKTRMSRYRYYHSINCHANVTPLSRSVAKNVLRNNYVRMSSGETDGEIGLSVLRNPRKHPRYPHDMVEMGPSWKRDKGVTLALLRPAGRREVTGSLINGQPSVATNCNGWIVPNCCPILFRRNKRPRTSWRERGPRNE